MSASEYGLVSLVVGVIAVAGPSAPLGLDYMLTRRGLAFHAGLRQVVLITSLIIALLTAGFCSILYGLDTPLLVAIFAATGAMGMTQAVSAHFQSQRQFGLSIPFVQASNWALLLTGIVVWIFKIKTAILPSALIAACAALTSALGWLTVARRTRDVESTQVPKGIWSEAISLMAINVAGSALLQLERLVIPMTTGIEELALFGVASSFVGSPFRMLQMAVSFTVIPRMRDARTSKDRRRLLGREIVMFVVVMGPASLMIWLIAPWLSHWLLNGRYDLGTALIVAMIVSGLLKVLSAFGTSVVSALAPDTGLHILSITSWACIVLAIGLAFVMRRWGLCGVIYAVSAGWLVRTCVAFWISLPYLKREAAVRV